MPEQPRKIRRYFTQQDYLDGLCDASGRPLPDGPKEPPLRAPKDSVITPAQRALNPELAAKVPGPASQPAPAIQPSVPTPAATAPTPQGNASEGGGKTAVDPLKLDPAPAETGFHSEIPEE